MSLNDTMVPPSTETEFLPYLVTVLTLFCIVTLGFYNSIYYRLYYYTHPSVLKNANTKSGDEKWADDETVPKTELKERLVWHKNELVTLSKWD